MLKRWLLAFVLTIFLAIPVSAQNRSVFWDRWDVAIDNIDIVENSFDVTEHYDLTFTGSFSFGRRVIPYDNLEDITDIRVSQDGIPLERSCSQRAGTYCAQRTDEGMTIVYNFFRPLTNTSESFAIEYTIKGALRIYDGGDQLWWIAVTKEKFGFSVGESRITVRLPDGYAPRSGVDPVETYGVSGNVSVENETVVATANERIGPNDTFEIRVQFPHNPNGRIAGWQAGFDQRRGLEPLINVAALAFSAIIGLGGPLGLFYLWYSRGRDPKIGIIPEYLSEPPSDLPPAIVGSLIDEKADMRDVLSTLIDLSHRGYIVIEEERTEGLFGLGGRTIFTFKRTDKALDDLRKFERNFIDRLFGGQMERTLDSLKNKFYVHIPKLKSDLYSEMVRHKFFPNSPEKTRNYWSGVGVVLLVVAGLAVYGAFTLEDFSFPLLMCIPVALGITALMMMIAGQYMPAKTAKGAEEAAKWKAFREYLTNLEKYRSLEEASAHFDAFLPYAVAFGMERAWIRKFKDLDSMPIPTWYYPTYRGGYWGRGYRAGSPLPGVYGSADDMLPGDLARAGGGGLNDLSSSLSGGLESISNGLTNLLNSAGSTMTSKPQSSGGGSWSGGGGGGGGGSGGGSSGFG